MKPIKVYLDDTRPTPFGWVHARWPQEVIAHLTQGNVTEVSLDHDLGNDRRGTGYDVLVWIEKAVALEKFVPPIIRIHTRNLAAQHRMRAAVQAIKRRHKENLDGA
jgi:hypothetical protein